MGDVLIAGLMVGDFSDRLCVRASRTWDFFDIQDETKLLHSNLVLIDEEGNSIHAQIYPQLADKFKPLIKEGNVYNISFVKVKPSTTYKPVENDVKIIFTGWTTVEEVVEIPPAFPMFTYSLTPIEKLPSLANSREYLIDVIGAVTMISDASPFRRQLGRTVTICNASNASLEIVLWGERATSFPAEQVHKDGQDTPQVVIFVGTLVKSYAGDIYLSGGSSCKWYINPEIPEAESLKASIMNIYRHITLARQATKNEPKASTAEHKKISDIKYLHPFKNKKVEWLVTVSIMKIDKSWWYNSCKKCFKTAKPHGTTFRCGDPTCNNIGAPNPRYKLAFTAGDETGETEFVMFGRIAQRLIKRTVDTLIANNPAGFIPDEITCLLEKVFTFNVSFTENTIQSGNVSFQVNSVIAELDGGTSLPITPVGSQSSAAKPSQVAGSSVQVTPQEDTTLVLPSSATSSTTPSKSVVHNIELETTPQSNKSVEGNKETTGLATPPKRARQLLETLQDNENNPVSKVKPATTSSPMVPTCSTIETQKSTTKKRTRASPTKKTAKKLFRNEDVGSAGEAGSAGGGAESRNEDVGSAGEAGSAGGGAESRFGEDDT